MIFIVLLIMGLTFIFGSIKINKPELKGIKYLFLIMGITTIFFDLAMHVF